MLRILIRDPGPGAFLTLGSGIQDQGWVKKIKIRSEQDPKALSQIGSKRLFEATTKI
jgi:hypothetical protein